VNIILFILLLVIISVITWLVYDDRRKGTCFEGDDDKEISYWNPSCYGLSSSVIITHDDDEEGR
jgi:hypothetical protein